MQLSHKTMETYWFHTITQTQVYFEIPNTIVYHYIETENIYDNGNY
jgi:hypothetical protein